VPLVTSSNMGDQEMDGRTLQAWQVYSGLFLGFWAVSAYCDHTLATAVLCLVFGCVGEQLTQYMYRMGRSGEKGEVASLLDMAKQEASLVPSLTEMAKLEVRSGKARLNDLVEADEEDVAPPPVPARKDDIAERLGCVNHKLEQLTRNRDGPTEL